VLDQSLATHSYERLQMTRLRPQPFTDRLVAKFGLPVAGWRADMD